MTSSRAFVVWRSNGDADHWMPTTLEALGKNEQFLETVIAQHPELMRLESRRAGIRGPSAVFRQVRFQTPQGRSIRPDIVIFFASGHVLVVEVKLANNDELKDRRVLAQIIDYAASFSALTEDELLPLFAGDSAATWANFVEQLFPTEENCEELAEILVSRMQSGELNLVIACDKAPTGLQELLDGVATQSALGFDLDLVEITPHVNPEQPESGVLFVPHTRLATEIVSRTAVTVTYRQGESMPATNVETTSVEEIEANLRAATQRRNPAARRWTSEDIAAHIAKAGHADATWLLELVKQHSADGQVIAPGEKINPGFCFYLQGKLSNGEPAKRTILKCNLGNGMVRFYLNFAEGFVEPNVADNLRRQLKAIFGEHFKEDQTEPRVPLSELAAKRESFEQLILWFKAQVALRSATD